MKDLYVDESFIKNAANDLNEIKFHLVNIRCWSKRLELIEKESILATDLEIHNLKNMIQDSKIKLNNMQVYIDQLDPEEAELIKLRYFTMDKKNLSFEKIGMRMHYAKSKIKKMNDEAIKLIAYFKYQMSGNTRYDRHSK